MRSKDAYVSISKLAKDLDDAIERKDVESVVKAFAEDCAIEMFGLTLKGKAGVCRWLDWLYSKLARVRLTPITIMIKGNVFFEEFLVEAQLKNGDEVAVKQSEVLEYENGKVKNLRLYFDRLELAEAVAKDIFSRALVKRFVAISLQGLK